MTLAVVLGLGFGALLVISAMENTSLSFLIANLLAGGVVGQGQRTAQQQQQQTGAR